MVSILCSEYTQHSSVINNIKEDVTISNKVINVYYVTIILLVHSIMRLSLMESLVTLNQLLILYLVYLAVSINNSTGIMLALGITLIVHR